MDQKTGMLAKEIRDHFNVNTTKYGKSGRISLGDSIHLATAIQMKVDVFQTFDRKEIKGNNLGLAPLDGDPGVKGLKIEVPSTQDYEIPKKPGKLNLPNP